MEQRLGPIVTKPECSFVTHCESYAQNRKIVVLEIRLL